MLNADEYGVKLIFGVALIEWHRAAKEKKKGALEAFQVWVGVCWKEGSLLKDEKACMS